MKKLLIHAYNEGWNFTRKGSEFAGRKQRHTFLKRTNFNEGPKFVTKSRAYPSIIKDYLGFYLDSNLRRALCLSLHFKWWYT